MKLLYLTNQKADKKESLLDFLSMHHNEILIHTEKINLDYVKSNRIDVIFSDRYSYLVPKEVIKFVKGMAVNTHPSYLPLNKGWQPNFFSIYKNDQPGVSLHYMDEGIDTGGIIQKIKLEFECKDTLKTSHYICRQSLIYLVCSNWLNILNSDVVVEKQESNGSYNSKKEFVKAFKDFPNGWDTTLADIKSISPYYRPNIVQLEK